MRVALRGACPERTAAGLPRLRRLGRPKAALRLRRPRLERLRLAAGRVWRNAARRRSAMVVPRQGRRGPPYQSDTGATEDAASGRAACSCGTDSISPNPPSVRAASGARPRLARVTTLHDLGEQVGGCTRCRLAETRTQVVFGVGEPRADLMFVGEAPGFHEDKQGLPFVGQAGKLLDKLLAGIGLERSQVFVANVLKCRPPGNRDPMPDEIESCEPHLFRQIELIEPKVVATLGNFSTKLLSGKPTGITRVHGQPQEVTLGGRHVLLYPLYHPAAALYTPSMLNVLQEDFARIPELLGRVVEPAPEPEPLLAVEPAVQLGLF